MAVMPLGDSITAGPFYRLHLARTVADSSCPIDFVGTFTGLGEEVAGTESLDLDNQGFGGYTTADVLAALPDWLEDVQPDVTMIYLGVNDFYHEIDSDESVQNMEQIIDELRGDNPEMTILLAQIMPAVDIEITIEAYNTKLDRLARRLTTFVSPVEIVDLSGDVVVAEDLIDGVHPNDRQSQVLASGWAPALAAAVGPDCELP